MARFNRIKLRTYLAVWIGIAITIPILIQIADYSYFYILSEKQTQRYTDNILSQVETKMDRIAEDLDAASYTVSYSKSSQKYLTTSDKLEQMESGFLVSDLLDYVNTTSEDIESIRLESTSDRHIGTSQSEPLSVYMALNKMDTFNKGSKEGYFTGLLRDNSLGRYYYAYVSPIYGTQDLDTLGKYIGSAYVLAGTGPLDLTARTVNITRHSLFFILDQTGHIVASNNSDYVQGSLFKQLGTEESGKESMEGRFIRQDKSLKMGWSLVSIVPKNELKDDLSGIVRFGTIVCMVMVAFLLLFGLLISKSITRPVNWLIKFMKSIDEETLQNRVEIKHLNEIGIIARYVNRMLDRIERITERGLQSQSELYESEIAKKQAEMSALQSQMNPHFLYNTLECIRVIGTEYKSDEIEAITTSLAYILRYSIKGNDSVRITEEMECIRHYIQIIQIRFEDKILFESNIDERIGSKSIVRMVLQPIIENAVYHGLEPKLGGGTIRIDGSLGEDGSIHFMIEDNGVGMQEEETDKLNHFFIGNPESSDFMRRSMGLLNIDKRLKLAYGSSYGIHIKSKEGFGTVISVTIPG